MSKRSMHKRPARAEVRNADDNHSVIGRLNKKEKHSGFDQ